MRESDYENFSHCWQQACEGAGKLPTANQIEWAFEVLKDKTLEQVKQALVLHARDQRAGQFQPKPADVIRHIDGSIDDRKAAAEYAWQVVWDAIGSAGRYASIAFADPAIHYAIMLMGGWGEICIMTEDAKPYRRRDFISAYSAYKHGLPYTPYFPGIIETENSGRGITTGITYIGNEQKAIAVMAGGRAGGNLELANTHNVPMLEAA